MVERRSVAAVTGVRFPSLTRSTSFVVSLLTSLTVCVPHFIRNLDLSSKKSNALSDLELAERESKGL